jgi:oligopeptide transport system substrate-binding protein
MKKLFTLLLAGVLALTLVACQQDETGTQVLNWNIGAEPELLDPCLNGASDGGDVINQTFEGLVREVNGEVIPGIAESWVTSDDGLHITFTLRESKWSDGSDLTANDFVYAWKRGMDPATASEYAWIWEYTNIEGSLEAVYEGGSLDDVGVTAVDDYTLKVDLNYPTPYFVSLMAFYHFMPTKQSAVEAVGGEEGLWARDPELVVSNGPFVLTGYESGEGLVLSKNEQYWNADEVYLETINGKFIDLETTAYVAYNNGALDVLPSVPNAMVSALKAEDPDFHIFPLMATYYYNFNLDTESANYDPIFANLKLRTALTYAINRTAICEALSEGQVPATGFVPSGLKDHENKDFAAETGDYGIPVDDAKFADAVTLFAEAATELGMDVQGLKDALDGKVLLYNTSEAHKLVAEMVQDSWRNVLDIEITLSNQDWAVFQNTREEGEFDISRGGWGTDFMDPSGLLAIFHSTNSYNDPGYSNAEFDTLMETAQATADVATHFESLYAASDILMADLPIIPVYYYSDVYLIRGTLTGWGRSVLGSLDFTHAKFEG